MVDSDRARISLYHPEEGLEERRFSSTRSTDHSDFAAGRDFERDLFKHERQIGPVAYREALNLNEALFWPLSRQRVVLERFRGFFRKACVFLHPLDARQRTGSFHGNSNSELEGVHHWENTSYQHCSRFNSRGRREE